MSETHVRALPAGNRIETYRIVRVLGAGGFGITYLALNETLNESVALKEYFPAELAVRTEDFRVVPAVPSQKAIFAWGLARFLEEARALHRFRHPNVVRAQRYLQENETAYIAMDYVEGASLAAVLQARGPLAPDAWRRWLGPLLDGLAHVHGHGYRHLDIKASNVMIQAHDDQPVLIDFGNARKSLEQAPTEGLTRRQAEAEHSAGCSTEGATGIGVRTPEYVAAEQLTSRDVDASRDIYALAALSYQALTGTLPPSAPDRMAYDPHEALAGRVAGADRAWLRGIDRALAPKPQDRPPTVAAWRAMLNKSPARHRASAAALAAGILGTVALVWWMLVRPDTVPPPASASTEVADPLLLSQSTPPDDPAPAPALTTSDAQTPTQASIAANVNDDRTLEELRRAAVGGDPDAQTTLGVRYFRGNQVERDPREAVAWFRRAADQGNPRARYNLGVCYERGEGVQEDPERAAAWYTLAANQNYASAQHNLGNLYAQGRGVDENPELAVAWFQRAADQGLAIAQYALGHGYRDGNGIPESVEETLTWYRRAAEGGLLEAQLELARIHDAGDEIQRDAREAASWYLRAAEQGNVEAQFILAGKYDQGDGVLALPEEAVKWHLQAAEQGHVEAQYTLGVRYNRGRGVTADAREALLWYQQAAEQDHVEAQYTLGIKYWTGDDVRRDDARAAIWFRRAAQQVHAGAQYALALMSEAGGNIALNSNEARYWYERAARNGNVQAQFALGRMYLSDDGALRNLDRALYFLSQAAMGDHAEAPARIHELTLEVDTAPRLQVGTWRQGALQGLNDIGGWNFDGRANQRVVVMVRTDDGFLPRINIVAPTGESWVTTAAGKLPNYYYNVTATLPTDGRYVVLVNSSDGRGGAYEARLNVRHAPIEMAEPVRGTFNGDFVESDWARTPWHWVLDGHAGQMVLVTASSDFFEPHVDLALWSDGELSDLATNGSFPEFPLLVELPEDGSYEIDVKSYVPGANGEYSLAVRSVIPRQLGMGTKGDGLLGSQDQGLAVWEFEVHEGQRVEVTAESDDFGAVVVLVDPDGGVVAYDDDDDDRSETDSRFVRWLFVDGPHRILVTPHAGGSGMYEVGVRLLEQNFGTQPAVRR